MKLFLDKYKHLGLNEFVWTDDYIDRVVEGEGIEIINSSGKFSWYMTVENEPFIVLPRRLKGLRRTFALLHELGHHFRHYGETPNQAFFHGLHDVQDAKDEAEADAFALVALIPLDKIDSFDFLEEHPNRYARKLFEDRKKLKFLYGV